MDLVLIPAYEPDEQLIGIARQLKSKDFSVLVVDDGSGDAYREIFSRTAEFATVITLPHNCGKGAALKAGLRHIQDQLPQCEHVVTCDADGQHRVEDVCRVFQQLHKGDKFVLTVRRWRRDVPLRSKIGNNLSRFVYTLLTNRYLPDNQSGLRGFHRIHIPWLLQVQKNNYDYEMNVLYYAAKKNLKITTVPIDAIYIGNNESSHFQPLKDTLRIYKGLFTLAAGSLIGLLVSEILVLILGFTLGYHRLVLSMPLVAAASCMTSIALSRLVFLRNTTIQDYVATTAYTIVMYFLYTVGCLLVMFALPGIPLFWAFNLVYLLCLPLRYLLHKAIYLASKTSE